MPPMRALLVLALGAWAQAQPFRGFGSPASDAGASTVWDVLTADSRYSIFTALLSGVGLDAHLRGTGPFTVFAPTDAAFSSPPMADFKLKYLRDPEHASQLKATLLYHIVPSAHTWDGLKSKGSSDLTTMEGASTLFSIYNLNGHGLVSVQDGTCGTGSYSPYNVTAAANGHVFSSPVVFLPPGRVCPDSLLFVEQRGEQRVQLVGYDCRNKGTVHIARSEVKPVGAAADAAAGLAFWSDDQNNAAYDSWLGRADLNGSDAQILFNAQLWDPQGMDTDTKNQRLFFTERQGNMVSSSTYSAGDRKAVMTLNSTEYPTDVAVDSARGILFTAVMGPEDTQGRLLRSGLDGSGVTELASGLNKSFGVCVDEARGHVFYVQGGHGGGVYCMAYGDAPCDTPHAGGKVVDGLDYPFMCSADSTWSAYGGPTYLLVSSTGVPGYVSVITSTGEVVGTAVNHVDAPMGVALTCAGPGAM